MIGKHFFAVSLALALSSAGGAALAGTIYNNGTADLQDRFAAGVPGGLQSDFDGGGLQVADDFTLNAGASTVTDIHWWGFYQPNTATPPADTFTVRIFAQGTNGLPLAAPLFEVNAGAAGRTATGGQFDVRDGFTANPPIVATFDIYEYWVDIAPLTLVAGTRYWLSVVNDTTGDPDHDWKWSISAGGNTTPNVLRFADGDPWFISANFNALFDRAFILTDDNLTGDIPEPGTLALFAIGLTGFGFIRRRRSA